MRSTIDAQVQGGPPALGALEGRVPNWALSRQAPFIERKGDREVVVDRNPLVLQRALEAGLQDAGDPASGRRGVPGICLRRVDRGSAGIPLPPGTGKVIVYSDSPSADLWRNYFPEPVAGTTKTVAQSAQYFILVGGLSVGLAPQGAGWRKP